MYVILKGLWFKHPFFKDDFVIDSEGQIQQIKAAGINEIIIDTSKGIYDVKYAESIMHTDADLKPPQKWEPEKLISEELKNAVYDKTLPPQKKARAVYDFSMELMKKLIDAPTNENIATGKKAINDVVDVILSEDDTSRYLLNITMHDFYTYTHSVNVGVYCVMLAKALYKKSDAHDMHELGAGFFLHDIGKVRVDSAIINKPGRLTDEEMFKIRIHPYQGFKLLFEAGQMSEECKVIVMQHHEREDGTGYPRRLKGEQIHPYGRICSIADVYDALTAERSYKPGLSPFEALAIMKNEMIRFFHKDLFEQFVMLFR
jgi:HD-GYP domain-containing protein (c-di-GMP phosphodiesterase class II)